MSEKPQISAQSNQAFSLIKKQLPWYLRLIRFEKPIGSYLLLWPTLWALAIAAEGGPDGWLIFVFISGVFLMRSAGCAMNDIADRDIDLHVARTEERPLTSGKITVKEAVIVFLVLVLLAFLLVLSLNTFTIMMSIVGVVLTISYPFMKRFHYLPQVHLGASFGWAVPMAFAAVNETIPRQGWLLYVAAILWSVIYDTFYAMADREDDLKIGVKSTAILFGDYDLHIIGILQALLLTTLWLVGQDLEFHDIYFLSVFIAGGLMLYHQGMAGNRDAGRCFWVFQHNHWIGAVVFFGVMGNYYLN